MHVQTIVLAGAKPVVLVVVAEVVPVGAILDVVDVQHALGVGTVVITDVLRLAVQIADIHVLRLVVVRAKGSVQETARDRVFPTSD